MRRSAAKFLLLAILNCSVLSAAEYGPPVGRRMPGFNLKDQAGKAHTLHSLLGAKGAVILFFRSADW